MEVGSLKQEGTLISTFSRQIMPAELSAAAILIDYWGKHIDALWISICLVVIIIINLLGAGVYGEAEFVFGSVCLLRVDPLSIR